LIVLEVRGRRRGRTYRIAGAPARQEDVSCYALESWGGVQLQRRVPLPQETNMSVAKVSEISASSDKSFEDAIVNGIQRFSRTVEGVQEAWVHEQKVKLSGGQITEYRVMMKVTFIVKD
jgi:hypothetical protein